MKERMSVSVYDKTLEKFEARNASSQNALEKRKAKAESLRSLIASYQLALDNHDAFIEEREVKSVAEQRILGEMRELAVRLNEELIADSQFVPEIVFDDDEDSVGRKTVFVRDEELHRRWKELQDNFNKVFYGRGGDLLNG